MEQFRGLVNTSLFIRVKYIPFEDHCLVVENTNFKYQCLNTPYIADKAFPPIYLY